MLILTLSSYNQNDEHLDDLVGAFPDIEAILDHIENEWGEPKEEEIGDNNYACFKPVNGPSTPGLKKTYESVGYIDNGYGGRYFAIWEKDE
jgi:hypothetical protein